MTQTPAPPPPPEDPVPPVPPEGWPAIKIDEKDGIWRYHRDAFMDDRGVDGTMPPHVMDEAQAQAYLSNMYPGATFFTGTPTKTEAKAESKPAPKA